MSPWYVCGLVLVEILTQTSLSITAIIQYLVSLGTGETAYCKTDTDFVNVRLKSIEKSPFFMFLLLLYLEGKPK